MSNVHEQPGKAAVDPYRPAYHFSPPTGWLNDPNGLIYWRGEYHLFYQHYPDGPEHGPMHWGHAVSSDLVHWRHLPIALMPDATDKPGDRSGIFSGSAVDDDGMLTVMYTLFTDTETHPDRRQEVQCIATSADGIHFEKYEDNPVIVDPPAGAEHGWRDPKVWRDEDGSWKMVIGAGDGTRGKALLYRSRDLREWEFVGAAAEDGRDDRSRMWECPDLFPLDDTYVLVASVNEPEFQGVLAFTGPFDGERMQLETEGLVDFGPDFYAPQTFVDGDGRRILIAWMDRWGAERPTTAYGWSGIMTVPRQLFLFEDGHVGARPVPELKALREATPLVTLGDGVEPGRIAEGNSLEIEATFDVNRAEGPFGMTLFSSPTGEGGMRITYAPASRKLIVDRDGEGLIGDGGRYEHEIDKTEGDLVLHIFVDHSSVELFVNGGRATASFRVYPETATYNNVALVADGSGVPVKQLDVWRLKQI